PTTQTYELTTILESNKYRLGGSADTVSTDGGSTSYLYEQGTNLTLHPITDAGLVGYWTFDEGTGTQALDSSGYNNTGTWQGTLGSQWTTGKIGGAGQFNGSDSVVQISNGYSTLLNLQSTNPPSLTISGWFIRSDWGGGSLSGISLWSNNVRLMFRPDNQTIAFQLKAGSTIVSYFSAQLSTWYCVVGVYDSTTSSIKLYVNGQLIGNTSVADKDLSAIGPWFLIGNSQHYYKGIIDDVRLYSRALSPAEVLALYNSTK
ncbi:MAG: LamG domain-containing protein, partial [Candidatus Paceibacterota bacterium]